MRLIRTLLLALAASAPLIGHADAALLQRPEVSGFIDAMVKSHGFTRAELEQLFTAVQLRPEIIEAITRPAESKPWNAYRPLFLTAERIDGGVDFWHRHETELDAARKQFGVDPQIIVAIIGVETRYGRFTGRYKVADALSTLAFDYPPRAEFFRKELEQFLLMTREEGIGPLEITGSYAGAIGEPQFMPSSYRNYAVDFDGDGKRDLWNNERDVIGSVANYFKVHGWIEGGTVAVPARNQDERYKPLLDAGLKPHMSAGELAGYGITPNWHITDTAPVALLELDATQGPEQWVTFNNFYVITRYNRSPLYAMAVYQLSEAIRKAHAAPSPSPATDHAAD